MSSGHSPDTSEYDGLSPSPLTAAGGVSSFPQVDGTSPRKVTIYEAVAGFLYHRNGKNREEEEEEEGKGERQRTRAVDTTDVSSGQGTSTDTSGQEDKTHRRRRKSTTKAIPYTADELLFRRAAAPPRYAEHDIYFAHDRDLPSREVLPSSDLLKAIHGHAAGFYEAYHTRRIDKEAGSPDGSSLSTGNIDARSMDETALLAFGILMEEAGRHVLGRKGDMVFTEGVEEGDESDIPKGETPAKHDHSSQPRRKRMRTDDGAEAGKKGG